MGTSWREKWATCFQVPPPPHPTYDLEEVIRIALDEDAGDLGDVTSAATIPEGTTATATFLSKSEGVLAGRGVAEAVIRTVDAGLEVSWRSDEGQRLARGDVIGTITGSARSILLVERVALNFMQRMSGIATMTALMAEKAAPARVLETRKTVPGLRLLDKWAVIIGKGENHRMGLFDMVMIKDNHVAAAGGISEALERVDAHLARSGLSMEVECETRTIEEVREAVAYLESHPTTKLTRIMLDNMVLKDASQPGGVDVSLLRQALAIIGDRAQTEASGNITMETVGAVGSTGVTFVSVGALTHSVKAFDISLLIDLNDFR